MKVIRPLLAFCLLLLLPLTVLGADPEKGFETLFDGQSLDAWRGYQQDEIGKGWKVVDGTLMFDGSGGGDIATKQEYGSFDLRLEWKVDPGSNSGIMYRAALGDAAAYLTGPEYQVLDDARHRDGQNPQTSAAALYALYAPQNKQLKPVGQWNRARIVVDGNKVQHWLNGEKVVEAELGSDEWKQRVADSKFSGWDRFGKIARGHIVLQDHGDKVWFRNIRIKRLDARAAR